MAKKRNYENDEAYKNFRLEDYLPSMNRREPEAKISEPEQDTATEETALFPPLDAPDISAIQAAASETIRPDGQDVQEDEAGTDDADEEDVEIASVETEIPGLLPDASAANNADSLWRSIAPRICKFPESQTASLCSSAVRCVTGWMR